MAEKKAISMKTCSYKTRKKENTPPVKYANYHKLKACAVRRFCNKAASYK